MIDIRQSIFSLVRKMENQFFPNSYRSLDYYREREILDKREYLDKVYMSSQDIRNAIIYDKLIPLYGDIDEYIQYTNIVARNIQQLYAWRLNKKIYRLDQDLLRSIINSDTDSIKDIPVKIFENIPYTSFAIEGPIADDCYVCFVSFDYFYTDDTKHYRMMISRLSENDINDIDKNDIKSLLPTVGIELIEGNTLETLISYMNERVSNYFTALYVLKIVLYILCSNSDIVRNNPKPDYTSNTRRPIKDKFKSIEIINVGSSIDNCVHESKGNKMHKFVLENSNCTKLYYCVDQISGIESEEHASYSEEFVQELQAQIKSLKASLSASKSEIYLANKAASDVEKKMELLEQGIRNERRELADLRELLFNSKNSIIDDRDDSSITLPYYTKNKIIIFGGLPDWIKKIKEFLPNVKFIIKNGTNINTDLIKNSDCIWIQTNAINHSFYYTIINVARTYSIPVRYFTQSSARKCAEQFIKEDSK